jgi:hypothetical protein
LILWTPECGRGEDPSETVDGQDRVVAPRCRHDVLACRTTKGKPLKTVLP